MNDLANNFINLINNKPMSKLDGVKSTQLIFNKLESLRLLDKRLSVFGSNNHKYLFKQKMTIDEISSIENQYGISFSQDYIAILSQLGNGGAGCGVGLEELNLSNINPPYVGTKALLRNWNELNEISCDMININEISGYVKVFDYGCGMECCLIVNGKEKGEYFMFDCDGRFEKLDDNIFDMYEKWIDNNLFILTRVKNELIKNNVEKVVKSEWINNNFSIRGMICSLMDIRVPNYGHHTEEYKSIMEKHRLKWLSSSSGIDEMSDKINQDEY